LYNPAYIELFLLVKNKKSKEAQAFIASRLEKEKNLTDIIFTQKDAKGNTVINRADCLGLQDFLDYCFDQLIVNRPPLDSNDCLIQTGKYSHTLSQLDFKMSNAALWIYGCARVCNQQTVCDAFSDKLAWNPQYIKKGKESLLMIAAWLGGVGSVRLAEEIRFFEEVVGVGDISYQQFESKVNYGCQLTHHHNYDSYFAIDVAAISKNKNMINFIGHDGHSAELLCFYIEQKDFHGLKACLDNNYEDDIAGEPAIWGYLQSPTAQFNSHFNIDYAHELLPIDLAIIKNWLEGVQLILERGFSANLKFPYFNSLYLAIDFERTAIAKLLLISKADPNFINPEIKQSPPIFRAIQKNNLSLVKLLVENKASVEIENKTDPIHRYPLVSAALNQNAEVTQYLIKSIPPIKAMEQLWNVSAFFKSRPHKERVVPMSL
jgi:ankyrin repeat protein